MGKGAPLSFLNKKPWHPSRVQNLEEKWKREQKAASEQKKLEELRQQHEEERRNAEFLNIAHQSGHLKNVDRLDWMYTGGMAAKEDAAKRQEEALLGQKTATFGSSQAQEASRIEQASNLGGTQGAGGAPASQNEQWQRLNNDPLLLIKKQQQEQIKKVVENPVKMQDILRQVQQQQAAKKDKKHKKHKKEKKHKKHGRDTDSDSDSEPEARQGPAGRATAGYEPAGAGRARPRSRSPAGPARNGNQATHGGHMRTAHEDRQGAGPGDHHATRSGRPLGSDGHREDRGRREGDGYGRGYSRHEEDLHRYERHTGREGRARDRSRDRSRERSREGRHRDGDRHDRNGGHNGRHHSMDHERHRDQHDRRDGGRDPYAGSSRHGGQDRERDGTQRDRRSSPTAGREDARREHHSKQDKETDIPEERQRKQAPDGSYYGLSHSSAAPSQVLQQVQYQASARAADTRERLQQAAARKEQEEAELRAARGRQQRQQHQTGRITEEERARKLAEMMSNAEEHDSARLGRLTQAARADAAAQTGLANAGGVAGSAREGDVFLAAASRDVFGSVSGMSIEARINSRKHFVQR